MMLDKARNNSIMLSTYNLQKRKNGWYLTRRSILASWAWKILTDGRPPRAP